VLGEPAQQAPGLREGLDLVPRDVRQSLVEEAQLLLGDRFELGYEIIIHRHATVVHALVDQPYLALALGHARDAPMDIPLSFYVSEVVGAQRVHLGLALDVPPARVPVGLEAPGPRHAQHVGMALLVLDVRGPRSKRGVVQGHGKPGIRRSRHRAVEVVRRHTREAPRNHDRVVKDAFEIRVPGVYLGAALDGAGEIVGRVKLGVPDGRSHEVEMPHVPGQPAAPGEILRGLIVYGVADEDQSGAWMMRPDIHPDLAKINRGGGFEVEVNDLGHGGQCPCCA